MVSLTLFAFSLVICSYCTFRCWIYWSHLFRRGIIVTSVWMDQQQLPHANHLLPILTRYVLCLCLYVITAQCLYLVVVTVIFFLNGLCYLF